MKKFLALALLAGSIAIVPSAAEAKTTTVGASAGEPQIRVQMGRNRNRRWNNRRVRTATTTRITRIGRFRYRETIQTTYRANGRTTSRVISRVRLGRNY